MLTLDVNRREFLKIRSRAGRNPARLTSKSLSPRSVASCLANASCTLVGAEPPAGGHLDLLSGRRPSGTHRENEGSPC